MTAAFVGCNSIDCPLNNRTLVRFVLKGESDTLRMDTLTIWTTRTDGNDAVIINSKAKVTEFAFPMSYGHEYDEWVVQTKDTFDVVMLDTIRLWKSDQPHFEAVDCGPTYFHTLTNVTTTNYRIDDISINNSQVDYDSKKEHVYIYFKAGS
ncbi:MAG: alpha amylase [Prevotella sp.]|nr:alpha amylase [Prevotella sp.]